ncbi:MAG: hypothetical protein KC643_30660 [Nitrospira sp.]|nr:hypothetical protein [Nitrospira sp.]
MSDLDEVINALVLDRDLVLRFFGAFSRFEYSLKRSGFLVAGSNDQAQANWDSYANSLHGKFQVVQDSEFKSAVELLLNRPPKKQVVSNGHLDWRGTPRGNGERDENYILRLVKIVRNNLFHGGKYPDPPGPVEDIGRDLQLIKASIVVLICCLQLSDNVRAVFEDTA